MVFTFIAIPDLRVTKGVTDVQTADYSSIAELQKHCLHLDIDLVVKQAFGSTPSTRFVSHVQHSHPWHRNTNWQ